MIAEIVGIVSAAAGVYLLRKGSSKDTETIQEKQVVNTDNQTATPPSTTIETLPTDSVESKNDSDTSSTDPRDRALYRLADDVKKSLPYDSFYDYSDEQDVAIAPEVLDWEAADGNKAHLRMRIVRPLVTYAHTLLPRYGVTDHSIPDDKLFHYMGYPRYGRESQSTAPGMGWDLTWMADYKRTVMPIVRGSSLTVRFVLEVFNPSNTPVSLKKLVFSRFYSNGKPCHVFHNIPSTLTENKRKEIWEDRKRACSGFASNSISRAAENLKESSIIAPIPVGCPRNLGELVAANDQWLTSAANIIDKKMKELVAKSDEEIVDLMDLSEAHKMWSKGNADWLSELRRTLNNLLNKDTAYWKRRVKENFAEPFEEEQHHRLEALILKPTFEQWATENGLVKELVASRAIPARSSRWYVVEAPNLVDDSNEVVTFLQYTSNSTDVTGHGNLYDDGKMEFAVGYYGSLVDANFQARWKANAIIAGNEFNREYARLVTEASKYGVLSKEAKSLHIQQASLRAKYATNGTIDYPFCAGSDTAAFGDAAHYVLRQVCGGHYDAVAEKFFVHSFVGDWVHQWDEETRQEICNRFFCINPTVHAEEANGHLGLHGIFYFDEKCPEKPTRSFGVKVLLCQDIDDYETNVSHDKEGVVFYDTAKNYAKKTVTYEDVVSPSFSSTVSKSIFDGDVPVEGNDVSESWKELVKRENVETTFLSAPVNVIGAGKILDNNFTWDGGEEYKLNPAVCVASCD